MPFFRDMGSYGGSRWVQPLQILYVCITEIWDPVGDLNAPNLWAPPSPGDLTGPLANPIVPRLPSSQRPPNTPLSGNTGLKNLFA